MPKLIKPISSKSNKKKELNIKVGLVQLDYNPCYRFKIDYLAEPTGSEATNDTAITTLQLSDRSMQDIVRSVIKDVRDQYLLTLKRKLILILDKLIELKVDLVCFPEYSIPAEILPELVKYSKYFSCIFPSHTATHSSLNILSDLFGGTNIHWTPGHSLYLALPKSKESTAFLLGKVTKSKFEPSLIPSEEINILPLIGRDCSVLPLMCSDFIQGRNVSSSTYDQNPAVPQLDKASLRIVAAMTPSTDPFFEIATNDLLRNYSLSRLPTAFVNNIKEGGTCIFALMEKEQLLEPRNNFSSYRLPSHLEAISVYNILIGPQLDVSPSPLNPSNLSKLTNLHVLMETTNEDFPTLGGLAELVKLRKGASDGTLDNITDALELVQDVSDQDLTKSYEPIELNTDESCINWRLYAASKYYDILLSILPSVDTQDRHIIETRLDYLEKLGGFTPTLEMGDSTLSRESNQQKKDIEKINTDFEITDQENNTYLTSVLRLTSLPSLDPLSTTISQLTSLIDTVENDPNLSLELRYEVLHVSDIGEGEIFTEFSIEMFVIAKYLVLSESDKKIAQRVLRDLRLLLQTGFDDKYRFSNVSETLYDKYSSGQTMKYRYRAGHKTTTIESDTYIVPYISYPKINNVLKFLFARQEEARLSFSLSSLQSSSKREISYLNSSQTNVGRSSITSGNLDEVADTIRKVSLLHMLQGPEIEFPEEAFCHLQVTLEVSEKPSEVIPNTIFRELLGDNFIYLCEAYSDGEWKVDYSKKIEIAVDKKNLPDVASRRECLTLFRFPSGNIPSFGSRSKTKIVPVPYEVAENKQGVHIGYAFHPEAPDSIPIFLSDEDRRKHLYVIGKTGTGKTQFLLNMIMQDIEAGRGLCVMDPHGDLFDDILNRFPIRRLKDLVIFDPTDHEKPPGLNLFEYDRKNPMHRDFVLDEAVSIFLRIHGNEMFGPRIQNYFRNGALALMSDPSRERTLIDMARLFLDDEFFDYIMEHSFDAAVTDFLTEFRKTASREKREMIPYFQAKFAPFVSNVGIRNIMGQARSSLNFRQAMDQKQVVLINLSKGKLGELNSKLIGMVMVSKVTWAAMSRAHIPPDERSDFHLYCDEFQNFATDSFTTVLSESRKYGLCLILANQYLSQIRISDNYTNLNRESLRDAVLGNVGSIVAFKIGATDSINLVPELVSQAHDQSEFIGLLSTQPRFRAIVRLDSLGKPTRPFTVFSILTKAKEDKVRSKKIMDYVTSQNNLPKDFVVSDVLSSRSDYKSDSFYISKEQFEELEKKPENSNNDEGDHY